MNYVKKAIENIIKESITDVDLFSNFYEINLLKDSRLINNYIEYFDSLIKNNDSLLDMKFKKNEYILFPKNSISSYRKCALISLADEIKYLSMVLSIGSKIEKHRIDKSKNIVFSYRLKLDSQNGYIFDYNYNYQTFRNEMGKIISMDKYGIMIKCDISNFYDRLNIHRLDSKLKSLNVDQRFVTKINELLLYWANRNSYSLPVGSNASRILAEAALIDVDNYLYKRKIKYIRFVDDFRIFCKDVVEAQNVLNQLIICLDREGLFLNSQKTEFVDLNDKEKNKLFIKKDKIKLDKTDDERRNLLKIIRGYNGCIPTKYRSLNNSEIVKFKQVNATDELNKCLNKNLLDSNDVIYLIKVLIANEKYDIFLEMENVLIKYPQLIPYYISAFIKIENRIEDEVHIKKMKDNFMKMFEKTDEYPDFVLIYLVRLFESDPAYTDKLFNIYKKLPKNANAYLGRRILEAMEGNLERWQLLELKDYMFDNNEWERRQILKCLSVGLCAEEFKPILKDYVITGCDELITGKTQSGTIDVLLKNNNQN